MKTPIETGQRRTLTGTVLATDRGDTSEKVHVLLEVDDPAAPRRNRPDPPTEGNRPTTVLGKGPSC